MFERWIAKLDTYRQWDVHRAVDTADFDPNLLGIEKRTRTHFPFTCFRWSWTAQRHWRPDP